jgi:RimJ/RimL family protein N-acetyltransferase
MNNTTNEINMNHKIIFLKGERINLRLINENDIEQFATWINDHDVSQFLSNTLPIDMKKEKDWIDGLYDSNTKIPFAIETKDSELIGNMSLDSIDYINRTAVTGAMIGNKKFWGKGYGSEAKMLLLDYAFNTLNLRKIISEVIGFNDRSVKYSLKCGYVIEGRQKKHYYKNGEYHDKVLLAVFKDDWIPFFKEYQKTGKLAPLDINP